MALILAWGALFGASTANASSISDLILIERAINRGEYEAASRELAQTPRDQADVAIYARFLEARILQEQGRFPEARDIYRSILATNPDLTRVRLALAQTLRALTDYEGARHNYTIALGAGIDETAADRIRNDLASLDREKRWTAQLLFSIVPTTNINAGNDVAAIIGGIPFQGNPKASGTGLLYGADFAYLHPVADDIGLLVSGTASKIEYPGNRFDDGTVRAGIGPQFRVGSGIITVEGVAERRWYGGSGYSWQAGGRVSTRFLISNEWRMFSALTVVAQRFDQVFWENGAKAFGRLSFDRSTAANQFLRLTLAYEGEKTRSRPFTYNDFGVSVGYYMEAGWGLTLYPEAGYAKRFYVADFPLTTFPRIDNRMIASLTLTKRDLTIFGFAPRLIYTYTNNRSNIGLYTYQKQEIASSLVKDF